MFSLWRASTWRLGTAPRCGSWGTAGTRSCSTARTSAPTWTPSSAAASTRAGSRGWGGACRRPGPDPASIRWTLEIYLFISLHCTNPNIDRVSCKLTDLLLDPWFLDWVNVFSDFCTTFLPAEDLITICVIQFIYNIIRAVGISVRENMRRWSNECQDKLFLIPTKELN